MLGKICNGNSFEVLDGIASELEHPIVVTDPPFNIGFHYNTYRDKMPEDEYYGAIASIFAKYPSVVILYPESLHRLTLEMGRVPDKVVSWVYPSNMRRQHRDIGFYGVKPNFELVRKPYRDMKDKRNIRLIQRTGGRRSYDWMEVNQVKNISKEKTAHPCQMPLAVMDDVIGWLKGIDNATIIDPFAGSGTTCVACERADIPWVGIEIDESYCRIIESRINGKEVHGEAGTTHELFDPTIFGGTNG